MPPPPQVGVASPISRELAPVKEMTGTIEAVETVSLSPQVSGPVVKVHVADGAEVKVGDPILDIDNRPFVAALARAKAEVARAESQLTLAKLQFERSKRLVDGQVISRQQFDDQQAAVQISDAALAAAKAALVTAELDLSYARITAPIAGRIGRINATVGNQVQGGGPVQPTHITTLVSIDPIYVSFDVDEGTWQQVGPRLRAGANGGSVVPVAVGLMGEQGHPHQGQVVFVDNRIDDTSGAIRLRAKLANPDRSLTPGAFARVRLETGAAKPVILVHERAVLSQLNTRYVLGVKDSGETVFRPVRLGAVVGDLRIVEDGLSVQDRIVVVGLAKVFYPGMSITPVTASMETLEMASPAVDAAQQGPGSAPAAKPEAPATTATTATQEGAKP
ncbi:MAG: efflux RND transporter periplasmic adaptor subunit [Planctomycetes bacterium]|nr:efflux RND transporter periplasmic adaptor subunit [Planctomycetota bacterium]